MSRGLLSFTIARKFLLSKNSDGFVSLIAWVSVLGVLVGVLALVVVTSVINGFEGELERVITGMSGDVVLYQNEPIRKVDELVRSVQDKTPELQAYTPAFFLELMAAGPKGLSAGAIIEGVDLEKVGTVTLLPQQVVEGRMPSMTDEATGEGEAVLGSFLAEKIGAKVGDLVRLTLIDIENGAPKLIKVKVTGLSKMGMYDYDSKYLFCPLPFLQKSLGLDGNITALRLKLKPGADSFSVSRRLAEDFPRPVRVKNWADLNKNLFYAIRLEKAVIAIILAAIIIVAAFNVVSTLMMMIHDKTKEIAILKVMGFEKGQSFWLFVGIGLVMGAVGTVTGTGLGLLLSFLLKETQLISLPADVYYISFLPVIFRWKEIALIAVTSLLIGFLATLFPALSVSQRSPLDGIRYE